MHSVRIAFAGVTGTPGDISVAIHAHDSSRGALADDPISNGTLSGGNPSGAGVYEFTASGILLEPGARYWVALRALDAEDGSHYSVPTTLSTDEAASAGWEIGEVSFVYSGAIPGYTPVLNSYTAISFAVIAKSATTTRLKLRVFLESALP